MFVAQSPPNVAVMSLKSQGSNRYGHLRLHIHTGSFPACWSSVLGGRQIYCPSVQLVGAASQRLFAFLLHKPELRFDSNHRMAAILQTLTWCVVHTQALASVVDS